MKELLEFWFLVKLNRLIYYRSSNACFERALQEVYRVHKTNRYSRWNCHLQCERWQTFSKRGI